MSFLHRVPLLFMMQLARFAQPLAWHGISGLEHVIEAKAN